MILSHAEHESSHEASTHNSRNYVLLSTGSRKSHKVVFRDSHPSSRGETMALESSGLWHYQGVCLLEVAGGTSALHL